MAEFHKVAKVSELKPNEIKAVAVGGIEIGVVSVAGKVNAFSDVCTHSQCSFSPGAVQGDVAICECHGSEFNIHTGEVLAGPAGAPIPIYQVQVHGDDIFVEV